MRTFIFSSLAVFSYFSNAVDTIESPITYGTALLAAILVTACKYKLYKKFKNRNRKTYNPTTQDPTGRYGKIESPTPTVDPFAYDPYDNQEWVEDNSPASRAYNLNQLITQAS